VPLQFQFHRALCKEAGFKGRRRVREHARDGHLAASPDELGARSRDPTIDASAILEHFAPLKKWLDEENYGQVCGS
jgi:peptidyl-dipeptidase A